ncbi:hypothetical protein [Clostridium perfringens]|uniref:hypothetical protein n=1 Tax=Clostridium perfringens TaxID=1502 RepID=UPI0035184072
MVANNAFIIKEMEAKAREEGKEAGKEETKLELAGNLLDILDDETIAVKTGLSIDVVKKLREESN